jgi:hypothetical protein
LSLKSRKKTRLQLLAAELPAQAAWAACTKLFQLAPTSIQKGRLRSKPGRPFSLFRAKHLADFA